jgi:hypothetical protein
MSLFMAPAYTNGGGKSIETPAAAATQGAATRDPLQEESVPDLPAQSPMRPATFLVPLATGLLLVACDRGDTDSVSPDDTGPATSHDDTGVTAPGFEGDYPLADASARLYAVEPQQHSGRVFGVGDIDGDGDDDLVVTTVRDDEYEGGAWLIPDLPGGRATLPEVGIRIEGSVDTLGAGRSVGVGDTDGDGLADVALGAPYPGTSSVFLLRSPITADVDVADAAVVLAGQDGDYSGHGSDLADVNGDGLADLLVGAYGADPGGTNSGAVFVVHAPFDDGARALAFSATATLVGAEPGDEVGRVVRGGGDVDGDGLADLLAGACWADRDGADRGLVHLVLAPFDGSVDLTDAHATLLGEAPGEWAGMDVALADVDGDGLADPIVGAQGSASELTGAVYVVTGRASGAMDLGSSAIVVRGERPGWAFGWSTAARDIDGDDRAELLLGALGATVGGDAPGVAYLFDGLDAGTWTTADATAHLLGETHGAYTGLGVALGDLDGDGWGDLIVGAPLEPTGGEAGGAVYVQLSGLPGLP